MQRQCLWFLLVSVVVGLLGVAGLQNAKPECSDGVLTKNLFSAGAFHTCSAVGTLVDKDAPPQRRIECWGWQEFGQSQSLQMDLVSGIYAGARHTCATDSIMLPYCWGSNTYGQLDIGRPLSVFDPATRIATPIQGCWYCNRGDFINDTANRAYGKCEDDGMNEYLTFEPTCKPECPLPEGRTLILQGYARPNTTTDARETPVIRTDGHFVCSVLQMSLGSMHTCVLYGSKDCINCNNGYMQCYGSNLYGQIDVPVCFNNTQPTETRIPRPQPSTLPDEGVLACPDGKMPYTWRQVAAGMLHTCAIEFHYNIICWGDISYNQTEAPHGSFRDVSAGAYHTCAITLQGTVECWGQNVYGEADSHDQLIEKGIVLSGGYFTSISSGASHNCGVYIPAGMTPNADSGRFDDGGMIVCWGANYAGQSTVPVKAKAFMVSVSVGWEHTCGMSLDDHQLICWGSKTWGSKPGITPGIEDAPGKTSTCISVCTECLSTLLGGVSGLKPCGKSLGVVFALLLTAATWSQGWLL